MSIFCSSVSIFRYVIDKEGLRKSPEKVDAIMNMSMPNTVTQLKSFLGMVNYYHRFIPNIPGILHQLYELIKMQNGTGVRTARYLLIKFVSY